MPTARSLLAGLALALTAISCSDQSTTAPNQTAPTAPTPELKKQQTGGLTFPVSGTIAGDAFTGIVSITSLALNSANELVASGTITGTRTLTDGTTVPITDTFSADLLDLTTTGGVCRILELDLGPLHLDLLGLVVDLSAIHLDITAESGPGNLLGNLLCSLTHLLDESPFPLAEILDLLATINRLLG